MILAEHGEQLLRRAIEVALGDRGAPTLRAILPLLIAPLQPKGATVQFELPPISSAAQAAKATEVAIAAVAAGEIDVDTGERIIAMLANIGKIHDLGTIEARLAALEAEHARQNVGTRS